ncbi:hypothetical protein X738_24650 [Mesorhizobium sp. LNHC209A00]|nr:hypothetical protein X738_24650 [Mesorhizobium sp. LNHC209A00]
MLASYWSVRLSGSSFSAIETLADATLERLVPVPELVDLH